jgi:diguanylate cyclase (GGDEF)-like protein
MRNRYLRQWRRRFSGLAFRIGFMVFAAALLASLAITSISIHSIGTFLRGEINRRFPDLLESTTARLDFWYQQRQGDVTAFARSRVLVEGFSSRGEMTRQEVSWYLSFVLERFPQYSALLLLDGEGEELLRGGEAPALGSPFLASLAGVNRTGVSPLRYAEGRRVQLVSTPVENHLGERVATLHAFLHLESLEPLLSQPEGAGSATLRLVDPTGRALGEDSALSLDGVSLDAAEQGAAPEVTITENAAGERIAASAVRLPHLGWTLVAVEEYDAALAPIRASLRRTLAINLLTALLSSAVAFAFAARRVQPILALAEGARRLREGESAVEVPDSGSGDEIQLLARSFNQMSARLEESRLELESRNEELQCANEALEQLSITDSLTRLHNHRFFQDQFAREAKRAERSEAPLCLVLIDIDDFKHLNDHLGHAAGDTVLARVAGIMSELLRETDTLCRYGGEEFALLTPQTEVSGAISLAEKIRGAVAGSEYGVVGPDGAARITVSIGVADFAESTGDTFNRADRALYDAKAAGKDCVVAAPVSG